MFEKHSCNLKPIDSLLGFYMLKNSNKPILQAAA